ncbi:Outer membrane protein OmpA [Marinobacter sp. DSM 26671]|nr:Outer membrane protein OmpA [Marinobacter sp. DSM 26671]
MKSFYKWTITAAMLVTAGCASTAKLSQAEIDERYPKLTTLETALNTADANEVDVLSQALYERAEANWQEARKWAAGGSDKADELARQAEALLERANLNSRSVKRELTSVLAARDRAMRAGAHTKYSQEFAEVDEQLSESGNWIAEGRVSDAREVRQDMTASYARLEVKALKQVTSKDAQQRIAQALRADVDDYAPRTLASAQAELQLANQVLEADANARNKAEAHAQQAMQLANQAIQIAEIIKDFKQSDMTDEQIVLWYQQQLAEAVNPVVTDPDFGQPNREVVRSVAIELAQLTDTQVKYAAQLVAMEKELESLRVSSDSAREQQARNEARFRAVQKLFSSDEAEVYRQGSNVLIRAYGFDFPSGQSEIQSDNFPLLNKITRAINQFPDSRIEVSGHTDSRGSDALNQRLSSERAEKVARFLVDVGDLSKQRVTSRGYGETRPLASNETQEGRTANRRVEILIINE